MLKFECSHISEHDDPGHDEGHCVGGRQSHPHTVYPHDGWQDDEQGIARQVLHETETVGPIEGSEGNESFNTS